MRRLPIGLSALLTLAVAGCGDNADKVIGVWSITRVNGKEVPADEPATIHFTKDGKLVGKIKSRGIESTDEGTYTVEGDKIIVKGKGADGVEKSNIITIRSIAGDVMVYIKDGIEWELKRK
jgi:uncharacterized protein (TIGR03066 family)